MPVVARCIQIVSGIVAVSQFPLILLAVCLLERGSAQAQESSEPASSSDAAPQSEPPAKQPPQENQDVQAPDQGCMRKMTDQQELTRKIRAINNPLTRIPEKQFLEIRRGVAAGIQSGATGAADLENLKLFLSHRLFQATDPTFVADSDNVKNNRHEVFTLSFDLEFSLRPCTRHEDSSTR